VKPQTIKVLKRTGIAICAALLVVIVWIVLRWNAPPLRIVGSGAKLTADVSTLGEYPTTVTKIRLSDAESNAVVWEVSANGVAQLHGLTLVAGQNPARIAADYGSYRVVTPSSSESFLLREGTEYRIELWGGSGVLTKKSASFHFGN
jgi:hypothetical protein